MKNPNGYGSVYKLSGNRRKKFGVRITAGWDDNGKQKYKYIGYYEKRTDAIQALAEYNKTPYDIDGKKTTFAQLYDMWAAERFPEIKRSTIDGYKQAYKHSIALHSVYVRDIRRDHLQNVLDNSGLAASTLKQVKNFHSQILNFAIEKNILDKNYSQFTKIKAAPRPSPRSVFTNDEIAVLHQNIDVERVDAVLILIYTGMRISELLGLKKSDININERYMRGGVKTKAGINRIIPINNKILPLIARLMDRPGDYLITSKKGLKTSYVNFLKIAWAPTMAAFNMSHTCHDTRHTFISLMDATTVNKTTLKRIVGHSTTDITEHYTHKSIAELIDAVNLI